MLQGVFLPVWLELLASIVGFGYDPYATNSSFDFQVISLMNLPPGRKAIDDYTKDGEPGAFRHSYSFHHNPLRH